MNMHEGHRKRMRERYRMEGLDGFASHEVIELLLYYCRTRGDMNPLAHQLLDTFGSLKGVLEAQPEQLMSVPGVGEETATLISLILPMFRRYQACIRDEMPRIINHVDAERYCVSLLAGLRTERFYALSISADGHLLGQRLISDGSLAEVSTYPRKVVETALNYNAASILLCHNHPSGACCPSGDDVQSTRQLWALLNGLDIQLMDHIIVAGENTYSMSQHGNLPYFGSQHTDKAKHNGKDTSKQKETNGQEETNKRKGTNKRKETNGQKETNEQKGTNEQKEGTSAS